MTDVWIDALDGCTIHEWMDYPTIEKFRILAIVRRIDKQPTK
jgi:hypothetical protein